MHKVYHISIYISIYIYVYIYRDVMISIPNRLEITQLSIWNIAVNICSIREEDNTLEFQTGCDLPSI